MFHANIFASNPFTVLSTISKKGLRSHDSTTFLGATHAQEATPTFLLCMAGDTLIIQRTITIIKTRSHLYGVVIITYGEVCICQVAKFPSFVEIGGSAHFFVSS